MATPICKVLNAKVLTGLALALGATALVVGTLGPDDVQAQGRGAGGNGERQMDGGGRGAGGGGRPDGAGRPEGGRPDGAGGERAARGDAGGDGGGAGGARGARAGRGGGDEGGGDAAPAMQFDASPVRAGNAAAPVIAQVSPAKTNGWLDEIAELESRLTLLEKRNELDERLIDSQIKLMEKRAELDGLSRADLDARLLDAQIQVRTKRTELAGLMRADTDATLAYLPAVMSIIGMKGKYQTQLYFPTGRISYARVGDTIAPGVRVVSVTPGGVEVSTRLGDSDQPQTVPLNFVSLPERRGDLDDDLESTLEKAGTIWQTIRGAGGVGGGQQPRPLLPAGAVVRSVN